MRKLFLLVITCTVFGGCKKAEFCPKGYVVNEQHSLDTIYPSEYFAAYPGSWWEYTDGTKDTCNSWEEVRVWVSQEDSECPIVSEDLVYLPENLFHHPGHIYGNQYVQTLDGELNTEFKPLLDTLAGIIDSYRSSSTTTVTVETIANMDTMSVNGIIYHDVIHMRHEFQQYYWQTLSGPPATYYDLYYARNIGLIKRTFWRYGFQEETVIELVDYNIANH